MSGAVVAQVMLDTNWKDAAQAISAWLAKI
jgi:hypothetical protein